MKISEVIQKIQEATTAIKIYRTGNIEKSAGFYEKLKEEQAVKEAAAQLMLEAKMLGPSGSVCPRCGGSGRA
ncbi:MAG: hypothetical protein UZ01_02394 [Candidatus Brocadia sinica]|nr:MAG: hypothetical protein UZ01_02394 [Candidatus Brocadia sinica]